MNLLTSCAKRIEHMQVNNIVLTLLIVTTYVHTQLPRYQSLKSLLTDLLKHFLTIEADHETDKELDEKKMLSSRLDQFDAHINSITRNSEDLSHLQEAGYSPLLWTKVWTL